jgi:hypothetical protein
LNVFAQMQMSLENDADRGKTAVLKRARIDHADTAISSDKNATTQPSIVGHPAFKSLGPHRRLAVQAENKKKEVLVKAAEQMMEKTNKHAYVEHGGKAARHHSESTISPNREKPPPIWIVCSQTQLGTEANQVKKQTENKRRIFFPFVSTSPSPSSSPYLPPKSPNPQYLTFVQSLSLTTVLHCHPSVFKLTFFFSSVAQPSIPAVQTSIATNEQNRYLFLHQAKLLNPLRSRRPHSNSLFLDNSDDEEMADDETFAGLPPHQQIASHSLATSTVARGEMVGGAIRCAQTGVFDLDIRISHLLFIDVCTSCAAETGLKSTNVEKRINAV